MTFDPLSALIGLALGALIKLNVDRRNDAQRTHTAVSATAKTRARRAAVDEREAEPPIGYEAGAGLVPHGRRDERLARAMKSTLLEDAWSKS